MDLLPRSHREFSSKDYWEKFFKKRGKKAFEWYGEFPQLCTILTKYIKISDNILVIGCGNSELSASMFDVGYQNIVNVDISATVIQQMIDKNSTRRPDMKFLKMDILEMSEFHNDQFSVVLDKGTLDAMFTEPTTEVVAQVDRMFGEVGRVLRVGGRYICISLAQDHILQKVVTQFADEGWMVRVCRVPDIASKDDEREFNLPVFAFIFTKFRKMPNMKQILEMAYFDDKVERLDSVEKLLAAVHELQQYAMIQHHLNKGEKITEDLSVDLYSATSLSTPRYTIHVVDSLQRCAKKFAIFIVPLGREMEWLFSTSEGRAELQSQAGYERLLVVTLHREHVYSSLDDVKLELSSKVLELAPPNAGKQSPFLSIGEEINLRTIQHKGTSQLSGEYVVEDVESNGKTFRRLFFLSNKNLVQSECLLSKEVGKKKKKKVRVDHGHLAKSYYETTVAGLSLVDGLAARLESGLSLLLVGLGGGSLPMYLRKHFPAIQVDVVEIDPVIVAVATDWFGLAQDDKLQVHVADGLIHVRELASKGSEYDAVVLDVDSKDPSLGMSCPPTTFLELDFLKAVDGILKPTGVAMLNLVCRSKDIRETVISVLKSVFSRVLSVKITDDVNETLYCLPSARTGDIDPLGSVSLTDGLTRGHLPRTLIEAVQILQKTIQADRRASKDVPQLLLQFEKLQLL